MSDKSHGGSGSSPHTDWTGQPPAKGKDRSTQPQRSQVAPQERQSRADRAPAPLPRKRRPPVVVHIGEGHPRCEAGTFDAAALLASVLASVEPTITKGLHSLEGVAAGQDGSTESVSQAIRTVGRQLADAVRAGVVEGMRSRDRHLAQLAVIDRAAAQASALTELQERIDRELALAGLRRISDLSDLTAFNLADESGTPDGSPPDSDSYELVSPAYIDAETGRMIERGWIRSLPATPAPAPAGKLHGSVSRAHKDRRRPEATADSSASPAAEQPGAQGPQEEPASHGGQHPGGDPAQPAAQPTETAEQAAQHQETRQNEHRTAPQQTAPEEPQPEDHGSPSAPRSAARPGRPEPTPPADPQARQAAGQDADARTDGWNRTAEPAAAATPREPGATEEPRRPLPQTARSDEARKRRRTAGRTPGAIGGVAMPRRYRPQPGTTPDQDNQPPRSTS
ncbi:MULTISPECIES: hypothetical protein [unclassified Streptomyces]|uniref:hypothetical protein n=1 Tax=unclassified Streptomyces TaxID=2593676 RepID=UPI0036F7A9AB